MTITEARDTLLETYDEKFEGKETLENFCQHFGVATITIENQCMSHDSWREVIFKDANGNKLELDEAIYVFDECICDNHRQLCVGNFTSQWYNEHFQATLTYKDGVVSGKVEGCKWVEEDFIA